MFHTHIPAPPLASFVALIWLQEDANPTATRELITPDGSMELVIDLRAETIPLLDAQMAPCGTAAGSLFCGAHSRSFAIARAPHDCFIGVHFRPGGAFPFFEVPVSELTNNVLCLRDLWKGRASELRERLIGAPCHQKRFEILEDFLLTQAVRRLERHPAVAHALRQWEVAPQIPVREIVAQSDVSSRRFIQLFRDEVGLTPKLYCRVQRFQRALNCLAESGGLEVALESGYFDQAHFIHEFRAFTGLTPTAYLAQMNRASDAVGLPI